MIKPLLLTLALTAPLAATANDEESTGDACEAYALLAKAIMEKRQEGIPLINMMKIKDSDAFAWIIKAAYKRPQYPEGYRQEPITDFQNEIYLECLESMD